MNSVAPRVLRLAGVRRAAGGATADLARSYADCLREMAALPAAARHHPKWQSALDYIQETRLRLQAAPPTASQLVHVAYRAAAMMRASSQPSAREQQMYNVLDMFCEEVR
ncbi:MAG: hypothetical protein MHM6MM_007397, partial [Cercozoa sp. M6MM]